MSRDHLNTLVPILKAVIPPRGFFVLADSTLPWVVLLFSLSVFIPNCSPWIPGGDSGELLAQACQLGTAHPPGIVLA